MPQNTVKVDSRKLLSIINDSAQSKVAFFEDRIKEMGVKAGKNWQLVALRAKELYFEDTATNQFYIAEHSRDGKSPKVTISNIREIQVVEEEKRSLFAESCYKLIESIETNDQRGMQSAFNRMKSHRFSSRTIPYSGYVKCRDNVRRKVVVSNGDSFTEDIRDRLVQVIAEGLRNNVIVENGSVVSGTFNDGDEFKLPVTKWASRKLVARQMREAATNAYWSQGFQTRVKQLAGFIAEGKINEAVRYITPFLDEMEEFSLLRRQQVRTLVENALAANAIFNDQLVNDTATLFFRTNLSVNKNKIVAEWRKIAKVSEHATLAENVHILSESGKNFEAAYDKFLQLVFEAISNREVAAEALATTLEVLRNKTPKIKESHDLSSKLDNLIARLKDANFDDAAIYEAEDLIATIQEELAATETLGNFDQIPSPSGSPDPLGGGNNLSDMGADAGAAGGAAGGTPPIVINSPLIQIGGSSGGGEDPGLGGDVPPPDMGMEDPAAGGMEDPAAGGMGDELGGDSELEALLGGGGGGASAGGGVGGMPGQPPLESKTKGKKSLKESRPVHYEMKDEEDDDKPFEECDDAMEESNDPYAIKGGTDVNTTMFMEYGAPPITDKMQLRRILGLMQRLVKEHNLRGKALSENLDNIAKASIKALGLRLPNAKLVKAVEQVTSMFEAKSPPFPGAAPLFGAKDDGDSEDCDTDCDDSDSDSKGGKPWESGDDDDEGVAEDQYHPPRITKRGLAKASINNLSKESREDDSIVWTESQEDAKLGEFGGVRFIFDHGGSASVSPIILSEDGAVELPIPKHLYNSAYAAAEMAEGDDVPFIEWLIESLEQLRPISSSDDAALAEAMAKITTGPDGTINVEVTDDVGVGDVQDGMADDGMGTDPAAAAADSVGMGGEEEVDMAGGDEMGGDGMAPVDSIDTSGGAEMGGDPAADESMPNYDAEPTMDAPAQGAPPQGGAPAPAAKPPQQGQPQEEEGLHFEDEDVTEPQSSKYTKHVKENLRTMPDHKPTEKADDKLADIGPELKDDDGSGVNPPTAKKMSNS